VADLYDLDPFCAIVMVGKWA